MASSVGVRINSDGTVTLSFSEKMVLFPGDSVTVDFGEYKVLSRQQFKALVDYADWRSSGEPPREGTFNPRVLNTTP